MSRLDPDVGGPAGGERCGRRARPPLAAIALLLALLTAPATAAAESQVPWETARPSKFEAIFTVHGSGGYTIGVTGWGRDVKVTVQRSQRQNGTDGTVASASLVRIEYLGHGVATREGIKATFPGLGRVSVSFRPRRKLRGVHLPFASISRICGSRIGPGAVGRFTGTIAFEGEGGYTKVDAHTAKGYVGVPPRRDCPSSEAALWKYAFEGGPPPQRSPGASPETILSEQSHAGPLSTYFLAGRVVVTQKSEPRTYAIFLAGSLEAQGALTVSRTGIAIDPASAYVFDSGLASATVAPLSPFEGTATFQRNADGSTTWSGSLAASLPPTPLPLAGPGFSGDLRTF